MPPPAVRRTFTERIRVRSEHQESGLRPASASCTSPWSQMSGLTCPEVTKSNQRLLSGCLGDLVGLRCIRIYTVRGRRSFRAQHRELSLAVCSVQTPIWQHRLARRRTPGALPWRDMSSGSPEKLVAWKTSIVDFEGQGVLQTGGKGLLLR